MIFLQICPFLPCRGIRWALRLSGVLESLDLRLKQAQEEEKTIETFDFSFNPKILKARIRELLSCHFIDKREHVIFVGQIFSL